MDKDKVVKAPRFKSRSELIKSFEEYSGFSIESEDVDTREKLLKKIDEIQNLLLDEISDTCSMYYREASKLIKYEQD